MPRQFNFRRDFPQLDREVKSHEEIINEFTEEDMDDLIDGAFIEFTLSVDPTTIRKDSYYNRISFCSEPIDEEDLGVFKDFCVGEVRLYARVGVEGEARPKYTAQIELRVDNNSSSYIFKSLKYEKKYGAQLWKLVEER